MRILLSVMTVAAVSLVAGCGKTGERAYFDGQLTVQNDSVSFLDRANNVTMRIGEESLVRLGVASAVDSVSYWAEFYGHVDNESCEDTGETNITVHIDKLINLEPRDPMPAELLIAGFYECLIDGVKQRLVVYPNYVYMWTIYPDSKYEIITTGSWQRTTDKELLLRPFDEQPDPSSASGGMTYVGTIDDRGEVYYDSTRAFFSGATPTEIDESNIPETVRRSRERNREMLAEEDAKRRATPRPGVTRFEFDPDSQALVEKQAGNPVFWRVLM